MNPTRRPSIDSTLDLLRRISGRRRIPTATYRVQFHRDFTFRDAQALVDYLNELGLTDIYASPCFKACSGSRHGYDICDPTQFNSELGDEEEFGAFSAICQAAGMGLILDVVPSHMGIRDASNVWWFDLLENGPSSTYASFFDVDFHSAKVDLENKVLLPLLDDQYGRVLESGKLRLVLEEGAFSLHHDDLKLPLAPRSYSHILSRCLDTPSTISRRGRSFRQTGSPSDPGRRKSLSGGWRRFAECLLSFGQRWTPRFETSTALSESRIASTNWTH